jgi:glycosyltransferase involved in cell wall biosynthesis
VTTQTAAPARARARRRPRRSLPVATRRTPHVTFVCSELIFGGAERAWTFLLPGLAERGFAVQALTLKGEGPFFADLRSRGISVTNAQMCRRSDLAGIRRALRVVRAGSDLLVSQNVNAQALGVLLAKAARVPHVTIDQTPPGISIRRYQELLVKGVARTVDLVIGVSPAQLPRFRELGFASDRIVIVPNGVEEPTPKADRSSTRADLGLDDTDVAIMLVADLRPQKEAHVFVDAVRRAHACDPRIKGVVVGGGPDYELVRSAAAGSGGALQALGPRTDVAELVNAADVSCLSSSSEGLPFALLEAMSLAKPVVATEVDGITDAVVHEETGILVPTGDPVAFADALLALAADRERMRRLGEAGRARYEEHFTAARMADAYAAVLGAVLRERTMHPQTARD